MSCIAYAPIIEEVYVKYGSGMSNLNVWGVTRYDDNQTINQYKIDVGVSHPCAGSEGYGGNAIDVLIDGQTFYGSPTYVVICPDYKMHFGVCFPPEVQCFDSYITNCQDGLTAIFEVDSKQICEGAEAQFTDLSTGNITTWQWHFEGGIPEFSNEINPIVQYVEPGFWDVTLTISNDIHSDTLFQPDFIEVYANPAVSLQPFDTVCSYTPPFSLYGGLPEGGEYTGTGVENGMFYPSLAGIGEHVITYSYTNNLGCTGFAEQLLIVDICADVPDYAVTDNKVFPNPSAGEVFVMPSNSGLMVVQLFDLTGTKVFESDFYAVQLEPVRLNFRNIRAGIYIMKLNEIDSITALKIMLFTSSD